MNNKQFGYLGEKIGKFYLQINQFQILKCNFMCRFGNNCIHFIEVKTRKNRRIEAREAIDYNKEEHIWKTAEYFMYINKIKNIEIQFDAIEIYINENDLEINYIHKIIEK